MMNQKIPMPVFVGILVIVLLAAVIFVVRKGGNRENEGIDMKAAERIQAEQRQKMLHPAASPQDQQKAYSGGK